MHAPALVLLLVLALLVAAGGPDQPACASTTAPPRTCETSQAALGVSAHAPAAAARRWRDRGTRLARRLQRRRSVVAELRARFITILVLLGAVTGLGTAGYVLIEHWNAFDALYMTVITVASVGFNEVHPLSTAGRAFTMALIVVGLGTVAYGLSTITAFWVEGNLLHLWENRKMERRISELRDHVIVCGGGETGRHIAHELVRTRTPFVIIEMDPRQEPALQKFGRDLLYVVGDATAGEVLRAARIETARGLIACMPSDKDNLFTLLTARELNQRLRLVSSVNADDTRSKLIRAGADAVVSGKAIGALRLASEMLRPHVVSFLDAMLREAGAVRVQEIRVGPAGAGQTLGSVKLQERIGIVVFALVSGTMLRHHFNPPPETTLEAGDVLIACASHEQLEAARKVVG
jgi:voltage-gated potassium channel